MNAQKPNRELSIGETLTTTFNLYSKKFVVFFMLLLISSLISGGLVAYIRAYVIKTTPIDYSQPPEVVLTQTWNYVFSLLDIALVSLVISWILTAIIGGMCVKYTSDLVQKGNANLDEAFGFTMHKLVIILASSLIAGILTGLGLIALIVPGIILAIMFTLVAPAIINENVGVTDSLMRSKRLVDHRWLKTFVLILIIGIIVGIVSYVGTSIAAPFGDFSWLISSIISALAGPVPLIAATVYYYSMVGREEQQRVTPPAPPF
jgi:hypothetical protein